MAVAAGAVFGIPPTNALNPFDLSYHVFGPVSVDIEVLDFDLTAGTNFIQNFELNVSGLAGTIVFTEHENDQTLDFIFGDTVTVTNANIHDVDGDGDIEYYVLMDPVASLRNDTDLGFNIGWNLDVMQAEATIEEWPYEESVGFGPLYNVGQTQTITTVGVLDTTFALDFGAQQSDLMVA